MIIVHEDIVHLLVDHNRLEDDYKVQDVLLKINKADMKGTIEAIKEYLRSCHGVERAPLAYIIRKTIIVQSYGDYARHTTPDAKMIAKMLHMPTEKNKLLSKYDASSVKEHTADYKIDSRAVYNIHH